MADFPNIEHIAMGVSERRERIFDAERAITQNKMEIATLQKVCPHDWIKVNHLAEKCRACHAVRRLESEKPNREGGASSHDLLEELRPKNPDNLLDAIMLDAIAEGRVSRQEERDA